MQCFTSCWRLVDWRKDSLDLASRVSSILLELCELEVFILSWQGPSQSSSPGSSPGKYSSGRSRSCPCHCIGGRFLRIGCDVNKWKVVFVFWKPWNPYKLYWILQWHPNWKILTQKKLHFYTPKMVFIQKNFMVFRRNQTLSVSKFWSFSHSVTQSLIHSVTQSLNHSVTQSLSHSVTQSLSHSVTLLWHSKDHFFTKVPGQTDRPTDD